jgi:hypothetical protein
LGSRYFTALSISKEHIMPLFDSAPQIKNNNSFNSTIYIPSKKRFKITYTINLLLNSDRKFFIVIEPQDKNDYLSKFNIKNLLIIDKNDQGISYVRNWIKNYSIKNNEDYHWQIDDNIKNFKKRSNNKNENIAGPVILSNIENIVDKYTNIGIASPSHTVFAFAAKNEIEVNKQTYSCMLINNKINDVEFRNNVVEDTDYNLQVLSKGFCTLLFKKLLIEKETTMKMAGGNTEISHSGNKRFIRSKGLCKNWPGHFRIIEKNGVKRIAPSRIWSKFKQLPIPKETP